MSRCLVAGRAGGLGCGFGGCGELYDKQSAAFGLVLAGDLAAMVLDDAIDGAQAEPCTLADGLGGVEGIEDALRIANARRRCQRIAARLRCPGVAR